MFTLFRTKYGEYEGVSEGGYRTNEYFTYPLSEDQVLITTSHRAWVVLSPEEYELLKRGEVEKNVEMYSILEDLGIILTERNVSSVVKMNDERRLPISDPPALMIMVPTNRCNAACVYCHARATSVDGPQRDMTKEIARKTMDFFMSNPRRRLEIEFQGGEPLLRYALIRDLVAYGRNIAARRKKDVTFRIVSNLVLMTDEIAEDIKKLRIWVCTSLDGPKALHDKHRPNRGRVPGSYDRTAFWIKRLRDKYGITAYAMSTNTKHSIGHEKEIIDEYLHLGIDLIPLRYVHFFGAFDKRNHVEMTAQEYFEFWRRGFEYILEKNREKVKVLESESLHYLRTMLTASYNYMCLRHPCGAGIDQLVVDYSGDIYPCDGMRGLEKETLDLLRLGNVAQSDCSYDGVMDSGISRAFRGITGELLPRCNSCAFNMYCGHCVADSLYRHGSLLREAPEDFLCETRLRIFPYLFEKLADKEEGALLNSFVYGEGGILLNDLA